MKQTLIIVTAAILVVTIGGWAFFTYGGSPQRPLSSAEQAILATQDTRLSKGSESAPVKIVEFADILCPYCAKANQDVIPQIKSDYIDTGKVHYEVRLVAMISPDSQRAAEGAYCAAEQDKFWKYLDTAYQDTTTNYYDRGLTPQDVTTFNRTNIGNFANNIELSTAAWKQCTDEGKYADVINQNQQKMREIKAYGTPHFIINGKNYNGAPPYAAFKAVIDAALKTPQEKS